MMALFKTGYFWSLLVYHFLVAVVVLINMPIGAWFVGWDSITPELNFGLNFQRAFFGMWQENYGVGLLGGHGFSATLPHTIITYLLSLVLPLEAIRPVFTFLCWYLGGLGVFFLSHLLLYSVAKVQKELFRARIWVVDVLALIASLFYVFNLVTVQMFSVPLEAFVVHFAALPWLFLATIQVLKLPSKGNLLAFGVIGFFASVQGFIPSLFVAYVVALGIFLLVYILHRQDRRMACQRAFLVVLVTVLVNAYWLAPFAYFTATRAGDLLGAYNNVMSTPDFVEKSEKFGELSNVALFRGFYWEVEELGGYMLGAWREHHENFVIPVFGYLVFVLIVTGSIAGFFFKRNWIYLATSLVFLYFLASIAISTPPFSFIYQFLESLSPVYTHAFRSTFTKFGIGFAFASSILLSLGLFVLVSWILRKWDAIRGVLVMLVIAFAGVLFYAWPVFSGNFFFNKMLVDMPKPYFDVIEYFENQPSGRIADMPQDCAPGWYSYRWGYFGSGFYWYGVKQPFLSRTFDVWSRHNENYYWEVTKALRSRDYESFDQVMEKYDARWVLYDPNVLHCDTERAFLEASNLSRFFDGNSTWRLVKVFEGEEDIAPLRLYERQGASNTFVDLLVDPVNVGPVYKWSDSDKALEHGTYISTQARQYDIYYPFRELFTKRGSLEASFEVRELDESLVFSTFLPYQTSAIDVSIPKSFEVLDYFRAELVGDYKPVLCGTDTIVDNLPENDFIRLVAEGEEVCLTIPVENISTNFAYLLKVQTRHVEGQKLQMQVVNKGRPTGLDVLLQSNDFESEFFVLPPALPHEIAYDVVFENKSVYGKTVNDIKGLELWRIPYDTLKDWSIGGSAVSGGGNGEVVSVRHENPVFYRVELDLSDDKEGLVLALFQGYAPEWWAITRTSQFPYFSRLDGQVLVNNWANGWLVDRGVLDNTKPVIVYLFFWPQILGIAGFLATVLLFVGLTIPLRLGRIS